MQAYRILNFDGLAGEHAPTDPRPEKLYALTREYVSGKSTRGKDFVDILLLAGLGSKDSVLLSSAIDSTFALRATHPVPQKMSSLSKTLRREYSRLASELELRFDDFNAAEAALIDFINPILQSNNPGVWNAVNWTWETNR